ncbi:MAG: TolC family protein [Phycisphaerae bacterium]|nr:TolC family protein [Phycisphaerae bacterium]
MRMMSPILVLGPLIWLNGCATYEPRPLDARAEMAGLSARGLPDVNTIRADSFLGSNAAPAFDTSDGLTEDEAVAVALTLNTDLRAARAGLGEFKALLIGAKVFPNPEVGVGVRPGFGGTPGLVVDTDLLFELLKPGERSARIGAATAKSEQARAEILAKEYDLATRVRGQVFAVLVAEQTAAALAEEVSLRERAESLIRSRRQLGEANELDTSAAALELAEVRRDHRLALVGLQATRFELNRLMGVPPSYEVRLTDAGRPLTVVLFDDPSDADLTERVLGGRLDLRAKEAEYRAAEEELRLAVSRQYPRIKIGPSFEHDGVSDNYIGVGATVELPIFDRNQGGIAGASAARDRLREEYTALLHRLTSSAFAARAKARAIRAEVDAQEREVLPLLKRSQDLSRGAFEARDLSVLDWITSQQRALRTRRAYIDTLASYRQALIDLDDATGLSITHARSSGTPIPAEQAK